MWEREPRRVVFDIAAIQDRVWAASQARHFARSLGFASVGQARLALTVAELASNLARHVGRGRLELIELLLTRAGCMVCAEDEGPGILAVAEALEDGFSEGRWLTADVPLSERRGLGVGLGAVRRAMDEMRVSCGPHGGLRVEAVLWLHEAEDRRTTCRTR
jgi:serine/threonine-protein kinase RsbT